MGYIVNHTIVVSSTSCDEAKRAQSVAKYIFDKADMGNLVSDVLPHVINGGGAFFISPDGSKERWSDSDKADEARQDFIEFLNGEYQFEWAEIQLGGDDNNYAVLNSPQDRQD